MSESPWSRMAMVEHLKSLPQAVPSSICNTQKSSVSNLSPFPSEAESGFASSQGAESATRTLVLVYASPRIAPRGRVGGGGRGWNLVGSPRPPCAFPFKILSHRHHGHHATLLPNPIPPQHPPTVQQESSQSYQKTEEWLLTLFPAKWWTLHLPNME